MCYDDAWGKEGGLKKREEVEKMTLKEVRASINELQDNICEFISKKIDSKLIIEKDRIFTYYPPKVSKYLNSNEYIFDNILYMHLSVDFIYYTFSKNYNDFVYNRFPLIESNIYSLDDIFEYYKKEKVNDKLIVVFKEGLDLLNYFSIDIDLDFILNEKIKVYNEEIDNFAIISSFKYILRDLF